MTISQDFILNKQLLLHQYQIGYRVAVDSVLVGAMVDPTAKFVLDMGAGVGAVAAVAGFFNRAAVIDAVEKNNDYFLLLKKNLLTENTHLGGDRRFFLHQADIHHPPPVLQNKKFHQVLINPPFDQWGSTTTPPDELKTTAFVFEKNDTMEQWWQAGLQWLAGNDEPADKKNTRRLSFIARGNMADAITNFFAPRAGGLTLQRVVAGGRVIRLLADFQLSPPLPSPAPRDKKPTTGNVVWAKDFMLQELVGGKMVYSAKAEAILRGQTLPPFPF